MSKMKVLQRVRAKYRLASQLMRAKRGYVPLFYQYEMRVEPRYGFKCQPHQPITEILASHKGTYIEWLNRFCTHANGLKGVSAKPTGEPHEPYWMNGMVQGIDPISLYMMPLLLQSRTYLEIGSGNSTKFVAKAKRDHDLDLKIISIDPQPRAEIDDLCDVVIRSPLENVSQDIFQELRENDVLVFDGSHYCLPNSDVVVFFLEVLPLLPSGVYVYIDDIHWPNDYDTEHSARNYSEQYMLAMLLLSKDPRYEIILPCAFIDFDSELQVVRDRLFDLCLSDSRARASSNGFWIKVTDNQRS